MANPEWMTINRLLTTGAMEDWRVIQHRGLDRRRFFHFNMQWQVFVNYVGQYACLPTLEAFVTKLRRDLRDTKLDWDYVEATDPIEFYCDELEQHLHGMRIYELLEDAITKFRVGKHEEVTPLVESALADLKQDARGSSSRFRVVKASELTFRQMEYLWGNRIPFGELTMMIGDPKTGKSVLSMEVIAKVTTGKPLPGDDWESGERMNVLLVTNEDHPEKIIFPRLRAAGADLERVHVFSVGSDLPTLPSGVEWIRRYVEIHDIGLIVLDPLDRLWDDNINPWRSPDVKRGLGRLAEMAHETDVCCVGCASLEQDGFW